jgi:hypothetical protein
MQKTVSLDKFSQELNKYAKESSEAYKKAVVDALYQNFSELVANTPVDTGLLSQSWNIEVTEREAIIGNFAPHAPIIEFGARPFTPPIGPLLEWARRVLKQPEVNSQCWALAKAVQMKISEKGMEPKHILTNQLDKIIEDIRLNIKASLGK